MKIKATKYDENKPLAFTVLSGFANALQQVIEVGTDGAIEHGQDNWKGLEKERLQQALCRHLIEYLQGGVIDKDSGHSTLAHIAWNALAILEKE